MEAATNPKIKFPIRYKLLIVIAGLLIIAIASYLFFAINIFKKDRSAYIFDSNTTLSESVSFGVNAHFETLLRELQLLSEKFLPNYLAGAPSTADLDLFLKQKQDLVAIQIFKNNDLVLTKTKNSYFKGEKAFQQILAAHPTNLQSLKPGLPLVQNVSVSGGLPVLRLTTKMATSEGKTFFSFVTYMSHDKISRLVFRSKTYDSFIIDSYGNVLLHPQKEKVVPAASVAGLKGVKTILASKSSVGAIKMLSANNEAVISAYAKISIGNLVLLSQIPEAKAFLASKKLIEKSMIFAILLVSLFIIVALFFSRTLTRTLNNLYQATEKVSGGDLDAEVVVDSSDEIGSLSSAFNAMTKRIKLLLQETKEKARMDEELKTAHLVQDNLFPKQDYKTSKFELSSYYTPATECGGDWWAYIPFDNKIMLLIGDATGHGVPAALITAAAQSACTTLTRLSETIKEIELSPSLLLKTLNEAIYESAKGRVKMTFFAGLLDLNTYKMTYSNASHDIPFICHNPGSQQDEDHERSKEDVDVLSGKPDAQLGMHAASEYQEYDVQLKAGDALLFYTDGITEGHNSENKEYGEGRVIRGFFKTAHQTAPEIKDHLVNNALKFFGETEREDDITLVIGKIPVANNKVEAA